MIPASLEPVPKLQQPLPGESPRRSPKLAAFGFTIRFATARSTYSKEGSVERSVEDEPAIDVQGADLHRYLSFSPKYVHRSLLTKAGCKFPVAEEVFAAVLFADISGFTRLSARLGANHLKAHINAYFGSMIRVIDKFYGDVIKFCGDAVMIVWHTSTTDAEEVKQAAAVLAAACSLCLLDECGSYDHGTGDQAVSLRLHCGIGAGNIHTYIVGNTARAEFLISGDPLRQIAATETEAGIGEVVVSPETFALIKEEFHVETTPRSNYKLLADEPARSRQGSGSSKSPFRQSLSLLTGSRRTAKGVVPSPEGSPTYSPRTDKVKRPRLSLFSVAAPTIDDTSSVNDNASDSSEYASSLAERVMNNLHKSLNSDRPKKKLPDEAICHLPHLAASMSTLTQGKPVSFGVMQTLAAFVQEPARAAIQTERMSYLAEIREVVTIFINIIGLEQSFASGDVQLIQKVMEVSLEALGKHRGAMRQFVVDDKGCVMILAFGLPRFTHEDNATRAVETSLLVQASLTYFDLTCQIGITSGQVYCGLVGSDGRHEYAMMGASVNLAARLMASCEIGEIRVSDDIVQRTAKSGFVFHTLGKIKAKGYSRPVAVFKPCEKRKGMGFQVLDDQHPLFGRQAEVGLLCRACDKLVTKRKGRAFLVRGQAGVGKTRLLSEVVRYAQQQHIKVVAVAGIASQKSVNYFVVTQLLELITGIEKGSGDFSARSSSGRDEYDTLLAEWLRDHVSCQEVRGFPFQDILSLLNEIVSANFPDHETVLSLRMDKRQELQADLISAILQSVLASQLSLLIVDDLQWVDARSLLILDRLIEQKVEFVFLMATRLEASEECGLSHLDTVTNFQLSPLNIDECTALVSTIVGERVRAQFAHEISEATLCAIHARSGGTPAYVKELSNALKEALFTNTFTSVDDLTLGVQEVTMQQFDQLRGTEQILLKAASVIGLEFSTEILFYALSKFGAEREAARLDHTLSRLVAAGLVKCLTQDDALDKLYTFTHFSLKETAYNLMLEEHRQRLHEAIASYYELQGPFDPVCLQMCVHHYLKTNNTDKKQQYLAASAVFAKEQHRYSDLLISCSLLLGSACGMDDQQIMYASMHDRNRPTDVMSPQEHRFRQRGGRKRVLDGFSFSDMFAANRVAPNMLQQGIRPTWVNSKSIVVSQLSDQVSNEWIGLWLSHVGLAQFSLGKICEGHGRMVIGLKLMGFAVTTAVSPTGYWWSKNVVQRCLVRQPTVREAKFLEVALECYQYLCIVELIRARLLEAIVNLEAAYSVNAQTAYPMGKCALPTLCSFSALCLQLQGKHEQSAAEWDRVRECNTGDDSSGMLHFFSNVLEGVYQLNRGNWAEATSSASAALLHLDLQHQISNRRVAMLVMVWAKLFEGDLEQTKSLLSDLEASFSFAQKGAITRWTLETLVVYHSLHGDKHAADVALERIKEATGNHRSNAVRAALVALVNRRAGNHDSSYKYARYAVQRFATRIQCSFMGHFLFFCVLDAIFYAIVRIETQPSTSMAIRTSGGVEEMKKYLTTGTQAFVKMSNSFPAATKLSKIVSARLLYLTGQHQQAATELADCTTDSCTFENATALLDLIRVKTSHHDRMIDDLKERAMRVIQELNLTFEARQLQLLLQ